MRLYVASTVHFALLAWHSFVWFWHFLSPLAKNLPGAAGFGFFFRCDPEHGGWCNLCKPHRRLTGWGFTRYLTFFSYTLQLAQLIVCCAAVALPVRL